MGRRLACGFALIAAIVCLYSVRQADPDLWGYLTYGRLFVEHGGPVDRDPFAFTSQPFHWVTFEYGAQLCLWWAYHHAGPAGLIALKMMLGGAALYFLYRAFTAMTGSAHVWVPIFLLSTSALSRYFLFRPQLFTYAFFAAFVFLLFRYLRERRGPLWVLPPIMLLWANTHGGFVAGLGAIGLAIALQLWIDGPSVGWSVSRLARTTRPLWLTSIACTAATFVNPLGARVWGYILFELTHGTNRRYIKEWAPATFSNDAWSAGLLLFMAVTLCFVTWAAVAGGARDRRVSLAWALSCVPLVAMSFLSVRHVPLAAIWAGPVIAMLAARGSATLSAWSIQRRVWFVLRGLAVVPVLLTFAVVHAQPRPEIRTDGFVLGRTHPCSAVEFIRVNGIKGRLYNPLWWGAYITWHAYPNVLVAMDGRNVSLFSSAMVRENLEFYTASSATADVDVPIREDSDFLLVPIDSPVVQRVAMDRRWRETYRDSGAALFERSDRPQSGRLSAPVECSRVLE